MIENEPENGTLWLSTSNKQMNLIEFFSGPFGRQLYFTQQQQFFVTLHSQLTSCPIFNIMSHIPPYFCL